MPSEKLDSKVSKSIFGSVEIPEPMLKSEDATPILRIYKNGAKLNNNEN